MKMMQLATVLGLGAIMALSNPALAQPGDEGGTGTTRTDGPRDDNNGTDYKWLGLLGLAGLAGLLKKPQRQVVHQTDLPRQHAPSR